MNPELYLDKSDYRNILLSNLNEKLISRIHKEVKKQNSIVGVWSDEENLIYAQFIEDHPYEFETA